VERGKGYLRSIFLGREEHFGYFQQLMMWLGWNSVGGFVFRYPQIAFSGQWCSNSYGNYMTIEEFKGGGRRGFILIPECKEKWGWVQGSVAIFVVSILVKPAPLSVASPLPEISMLLWSVRMLRWCQNGGNQTSLMARVSTGTWLWRSIKYSHRGKCEE
jgi:hypothetical protein